MNKSAELRVGSLGEVRVSPEIPTKTYWVQVFTPKTWERFVDYGARVTGFRDLRWKHIQKLKPGDYLLCYLSGLSKWIGVLEVESDPYLDTTRIWDEDLFPCRVNVRLLTKLNLDNAVPIKELSDRLSIFRTKKWSLYLISSPAKWQEEDGEIVLDAVVRAQQNPNELR